MVHSCTTQTYLPRDYEAVDDEVEGDVWNATPDIAQPYEAILYHHQILLNFLLPLHYDLTSYYCYSDKRV